MVQIKQNKEILKYKLLSNIEINENNCWIWTKSKHPDGYGKTSYCFDGKRKHLNTHRLSWILFKGNIPKGFFICHNCPGGDNPSCCNPDHLFLGTPKDNTRDMIKKGRDPFDFIGEKNNSAILTESIVLEMRSLRKKGMKIKDIANKFNIKYFTCLDAVSGRNWKHI